ncbi:MAG: hypothetical protein EOO45_31750, partial [Flavobacterium sp.]
MKILKYALCLIINFSLIGHVKSQKTVVIPKLKKTIGPTRFKSLNYLYGISGKYTIAGIHNREPNAEPAKWTDQINVTTGRYPGLWSGDFLFQQENISNRQTMINEAAKQWSKGSVVNVMWHACNPALEQPCGWDKKGVLSKLTDQQ